MAERARFAGYQDSLWWSTVPEQAPRPPLMDHIESDITIVGAGFSGLWTAYYIKHLNPDARVVMVEAEVAGAGASSRNGGWASALLPVTWETIEQRYGRDATLAYQQAADDNLTVIREVLREEGIDADLAADGYLRVATDQAQLAKLRAELDNARSWNRTEHDAQWLSAEETKARINGPDFLGGMFIPHCMALNPAKLVRGLAAAVEGLGVTIYEQSFVSSIRDGIVYTDQGRVNSGLVVLAVEGYASQVEGFRRLRLPVHSTMVATEPLSAELWDELGWRQRSTINDLRRHLFYAQRTVDGRIAFGGRGAPYKFASQVELNRSDAIDVSRIVEEVLYEVFPMLQGTEISHRWSGVLGVPRDWMPSVQINRADKLALIGGYSGDGVALTHMAGRTLAHLITGVPSPLTALPLVGHSSPTWEPEPLRVMGVRLTERLARHADGVERHTGKPSWSGKVFSKLSGH
ncbi:MAG TPA: FAD-binding oxidoreductase [Marmoricola sp.]|nr:FAD-dependent oxidoreductase [Nocardioidaceae bacterium]MCO5323447.1 FAD-binding oxidoreductase [Nocardioidaceae bacterium]HRV69480.1 FAD-binding oxidoreductase [Marmoricola sp.]